jgi:DNA polymerase-1
MTVVPISDEKRRKVLKAEIDSIDSLGTLVSDTENNGLLPTVDLFHCAGAIELETGREFWFKPGEGDLYLELLDKARLVVFHKADYDQLAMEKIFGWVPKAAIRCSLVMSQVLNYTRFGFGHSLSQWGQFAENENDKAITSAHRKGDTEEVERLEKLKGKFFKGDYDGGFDEYSKEMFVYMQQDVRLLKWVYEYLKEELHWFVGMSGNQDVLKAIRNEQEMGFLAQRQSLTGWLINKPEALVMVSKLEDLMRQSEEKVNKLLGLKVIKEDGMNKDTGFAKTKTTAVLKNGRYHSWLVKWFGIDSDTLAKSGPVQGEFTRVKFTSCDIGNTEDVKRYLFSIGWEPDEWNWKRVGGTLTKTSPKLTDSSLAKLGEAGEPFLTYYTYRSRHSILTGWLNGEDKKTGYKYLDSNDHLHGDVFNIGTPTFRQTHKILVNLPSGKALFGPEIRKLFIVKKGYKLVSADSAACQLRLLAHYLNIPEFTAEVLEGDIHQKNADILGCTRDQAKPFIFAFLYGAGGNKLGAILGVSAEEGNRLKRKFLAAYPFLKKFIDKMTRIAKEQGFIIGLDGRPVHVDSVHKALNYVIQSAEAIVMKATVIWIHKRFKEKDIDYEPRLFYHDEDTYQVREDQVIQARAIIKAAFKLAPREFGVDIMRCGDCKIGKDYYEVH